MAGAQVTPVRVRRWDIVVGVWVVCWILAGVATWYELWQLTALATSVVDSGDALGTAGQALKDVSGAPFVGERIGQLGDQVSRTGAGVVQSGQTAAQSIQRLSILIALAVGIGPAGPVLVAYLPSRRLWSRQQRAGVDTRSAQEGPAV